VIEKEGVVVGWKDDSAEIDKNEERGKSVCVFSSSSSRAE
jgi:hypothetical protein